MADSRTSAADAPVDGLTLQTTVVATLELELLRGWENGPSRAAGAIEYQLARQDVQSGDHSAALVHLSQAIQAHPSYAVMAAQDLDLNPIREPVRDLVGRLTVLARMSAEASILEAGESVHAFHAPEAVQQAQAYLDMAQAQFQTSSYAGYVQASQAAAFAQHIAAHSNVTALVRPLPVEGLILQSTAASALEPEFLSWEDGPVLAAGATQYQLARNAVQSGDYPAALDHLGQAILTHPSYAITAAQDPELTEIKEPVRDLVGRLTVVARIHAEASIVEAGESVRALHAPASVQQAQAYLDMAQAQFHTASYAGYVQAAQAAAFAQQIAEHSKVMACAQPAALTHSSDAGSLRQIGRAAKQATRRLWQKLPLLAILLGWLLAGIAGGLVCLAFQNKESEMRHLLFSIWALGLLGMVVLGFLRSIRNIRIGRLK